MERSLSHLISDIHCDERVAQLSSNLAHSRDDGGKATSESESASLEEPVVPRRRGDRPTDRPTDRDRLPWQKMAAHLADDIKAYIKPAKKAIQPLDGLT